MPWRRNVRKTLSAPGPIFPDSSALVPKCLGSEVSWVRSVLTPSFRMGSIMGGSGCSLINHYPDGTKVVGTYIIIIIIIIEIV